MYFLTASTLDFYYDLCPLLFQDIKTSHSLVFHKSFVVEIIMAFRVKSSEGLATYLGRLDLVMGEWDWLL